MRRAILLAGVAVALTSTMALATPESLLPPGFGDPEPAPTATAAPRPSGPAPSATSSPVVQPLPSGRSAPRAPSASAPSLPTPGERSSLPLPSNFPSLSEIERMEPDQIDELFGLKPKFDMPPGAQRAVQRIGIIGQSEGGFPSGSLTNQPYQLIQAALQGTRGPLVSRWGHILLRRALASRLDAPRTMDPVAFVALRAALLNRLGEGQAARSLVQDVDSANYDRRMADAAFDAYLATGDVLGMCPVARLKGDLREDGEWLLLRSVCQAFAGEARQSERNLNRALGRGEAPRIDVLLAQRFAGAAADSRRAVNIEWDGVDELTPWRFSFARALGVELPDGLRGDAGARFDLADVQIPAVPLAERIAAADMAAQRGVLSSSAVVDLYSQVWADAAIEGEPREDAQRLREAYVARTAARRFSAIRSLWGDGSDYGRQVLTSYAAARLPINGEVVEDPSALISSMLSAGLDRDAQRWSDLVEEGSLSWALLALSHPDNDEAVDSGDVETFMDADGSRGGRKSRFLLAGLAGLGRLDDGDAADLAEDLNVNLNRQSPWSRAIDQAAGHRNAALVALLAGLGMQGEGWDKMTARHLFHIVRSLNQVGLGAEARMIAAEAVARG